MMITMRGWIVGGAVFFLLAVSGVVEAQSTPDLIEFRSGKVTWTNADPTLYYTVEWRSEMTESNWTGSYRGLQDLQSSASIMTADVPMFIRIAGSSNAAHTFTLSAATTTVAEGYYAATNLASVDPDLATPNIRAGVTIFGVTGKTEVVDTSSGDAVAIDLLEGKKAWVDGVEIIGVRNGYLSWTGAPNPRAIYRVEWASRTNGPWHSFTYQPINTIDAHGATNFTVEVPLYYRVVTMTNQPPQGMVWIDSGDCALGDTSGVGSANELPVHTNFIGGFWMEEMEVTKAKWDEVFNWAIAYGYQFENAGSGKTNNHPVQTVNWYDCVKWCNARSQKEGLTPCYYTSDERNVLYTTGSLNIGNTSVNWRANGYRLPTEAEWEKAARGGRQGRLFPWGGDTIQHARANYYADSASYPYDTSPTQGFHPTYNDGVFPYTSPVGSFPANGYGLHDMAGNAWEWCWDWYGDYAASRQTDPQGPSSGQYGVFRVLRDGSWAFVADYARCANRDFSAPAVAGHVMGFRCVRGP